MVDSGIHPYYAERAGEISAIPGMTVRDLASKSEDLVGVQTDLWNA